MKVRAIFVALVVCALALTGALWAETAPPATAQEIFGTPEVIWLVNCDFTFNQCLSSCPLYGDPQACELACTCSYYACKGFEIPNECI
jgi:hypothetical protein